MRNLLLAAALALGLGFAATGAQAAPVSSNLAAVGTAAESGKSVVEKTGYYRDGYYYRSHRYYRHRPYWQRGYYRPRHWRPRTFGYQYRYHHRRHWRPGYSY